MAVPQMKRTAKTQEALNAQCDKCVELLQEARETLMQIEGVIGVGWGPKEKGGQLLEDEHSFIVYVEEKKDKKALSPKQLIPSEFKNVSTDVVVPGQRRMPYHYEHDFAWVDWSRVHARNPHRDVNLAPSVDFDMDHVAVLEIDDTFVSGTNIDWVKAVKRFLQSHPDAFDFVTFFVDTASGLPGQGSWHSGVYNETTGINYYAGLINQRASYGSQKLRAIQSISFFGNYVMLQETGHMWGAYVRNRDTQAGTNLYDLLIGSTGQGVFHWGRFFDNDHSPMDYDGIDWQALSSSQFQSHGIADDFFHFHPLDLYLMGLISPGEVGSFTVIQNPSANSGTITGTPKNMTVQNVIWAEGARNPAYPNAQNVWRQAFVVLTKNAQGASSFVQSVAQQRRKHTWQFYKGTRFLGKADSTLRSFTLFPEIRDVFVAVDNDRAIVGWRTNVRTKGKVNFATNPAAFRRDQAHTEPFSSVAESAFDTSHGVLLTGLTPNTTYDFEIVAETEEGLFDRKGVEQLYTRKTNDTCPPDINNVTALRSRIIRNKVTVRWQTDELADSLILYGTSIPPSQQRYDPYPTTNHSTALTGLAAGTYYIAVQSRDAAGNATLDNNSGSYYQVVVPPSAPTSLRAVSADEIAQRLEEINSCVQMGEFSRAVEQTSHFILNVAEHELTEIVRTTTLPADPLEAGYAALETLVARLDCQVGIVESDANHIDFVVEPDVLTTISCIHLPADMVAQESGYPVLPALASKVHPSLTLHNHPDRGVGHYRLSKI